MHRIDNATLKKDRMMFAQVLIDMEPQKGFIEENFLLIELMKLSLNKLYMIGSL